MLANPDSIDTNEVQFWTYDAGTGRYSGAMIGANTKSGSDHFHGTFFEFVRNDIFNANDYFLKHQLKKEPVLLHSDKKLARRIERLANCEDNI